MKKKDRKKKKKKLEEMERRKKEKAEAFKTYAEGIAIIITALAGVIAVFIK